MERNEIESMSVYESNDELEINSGGSQKPEPNYRGIKAMPFVVGNEAFEKLGSMGTTANLLIYLTTVFNLNSFTATNFLNVFNGVTNFGTLIAAFLCDTYFGRYKTLGFASISSFLGMLLLTLTSAIPGLHPPKCGAEAKKCSEATAWQMAFLVASFGLLTIGGSGIRPCNLAFGADQFNPNTDSGKRGLSTFFNWYYFTSTFSMMLSSTVIVYVQSDVSWALGLTIPAFLMFSSCVLFFVGTGMYVIVQPEGSPLTNVVQVVVAAVKKRKLKLPAQPSLSLFNHFPPHSINEKLPYTDQFSLLNKAAIITAEDKINPNGSAGDPWRLCSIQKVEEVKCVVRLIPIWVSGTFFMMMLTQQSIYAVFQALQSDRRIGIGNLNFKIPAASYSVFQWLALTIWIPIYDRIMIPFLRKLTKQEAGLTILQKIGVGMAIAVLSTLLSGLVENKRKNYALTRPTLGFMPRKGAVSSLSGYWLVLQLGVTGISEAFALVGLTEFLYREFPENMRSFGGAFLFCSMGLSSYLCSFLISVVHQFTRNSYGENWLAEDLNKGNLDYYYYSVASLGFLNFVYFLMCAQWYKYKGTSGGKYS